MKYFILLLLAPLLAFSQSKKGKLQLAENISLIWVIKPFIKKEHTVLTCGAGEQQYICTIDGKPWYGSDMGMEMPRNQLVKFTLVIGSTYIYPEISGMFNTNFSGTLNDDQIKIKEYGDQYILSGFFSDGAGTYMVIWRIVGNTAIRELISSDEAYFGQF